MLKDFGQPAAIFFALVGVYFASAYLLVYAFAAASWDAGGWIVAAICLGVCASAFLGVNAVRGRAALRWAAYELSSFGLLLAICLGSARLLEYMVEAAGGNPPDWLSLAGLGVGILVWSVLPASFLERLRIIPRQPPLKVRPSSRGYAKGIPQRFLLDRSIRQDPLER